MTNGKVKGKAGELRKMRRESGTGLILGRNRREI